MMEAAAPPGGAWCSCHCCCLLQAAAGNKRASTHVVRPAKPLGAFAGALWRAVSRLVSLNAISSPDKVRPAPPGPCVHQLARRNLPSKPDRHSPSNPAKPATQHKPQPPPPPHHCATTTQQPHRSNHSRRCGPPDWRTYGLSRWISTWQPLRQPGRVRAQNQASSVSGGKPARQKINTTGEAGVWKTWAATPGRLARTADRDCLLSLQRPSAAATAAAIATAGRAATQALAAVHPLSLISSAYRPAASQPAPTHPLLIRRARASARRRSQSRCGAPARKHPGPPLERPIGGTAAGRAVVTATAGARAHRRASSSVCSRQVDPSATPSMRRSCCLGQLQAGSLLLLHVVCELPPSRPHRPTQAVRIGRT